MVFICVSINKQVINKIFKNQSNSLSSELFYLYFNISSSILSISASNAFPYIHRFIGQLIILVSFILLTIYNYYYAQNIYNFIVAPFMNIFSQYVTSVDNDIKTHKRKVSLVKAMDQKDKNPNQIIKVQPIGFIKQIIYNSFQDPTTFQQNIKKQ